MKKHLIAVVAVLVGLNHQAYGMDKFFAAIRTNKKVAGVFAAALCKARPDEGSPDTWNSYRVYAEREIVVMEKRGIVTIEHRVRNFQEKSATFYSEAQNGAEQPHLHIEKVRDLDFSTTADIEVNMTRCTLKHKTTLQIVCGQTIYAMPDVHTIESRK